MGDISEMTMDELSEYAVSLPEWDWSLMPWCDTTRPDLNDPGIGGCLLAMVRRKHGASIYTCCDAFVGWFVENGGNYGPPIAFHRLDENIGYVGFEEEVHALVAALAKGAS